MYKKIKHVDKNAPEKKKVYIGVEGEAYDMLLNDNKDFPIKINYGKNEEVSQSVQEIYDKLKGQNVNPNPDLRFDNDLGISCSSFENGYRFESVQEKLMYELIVMRLTQNPPLLKALLDTNNSIIIDSKHKESNTLGVLLEAARDELNRELMSYGHIRVKTGLSEHLYEDLGLNLPQTPVGEGQEFKQGQHIDMSRYIIKENENLNTSDDIKAAQSAENYKLYHTEVRWPHSDEPKTEQYISYSANSQIQKYFASQEVKTDKTGELIYFNYDSKDEALVTLQQLKRNKRRDNQSNCLHPLEPLEIKEEKDGTYSIVYNKKRLASLLGEEETEFLVSELLQKNVTQNKAQDLDGKKLMDSKAISVGKELLQSMPSEAQNEIETKLSSYFIGNTGHFITSSPQQQPLMNITFKDEHDYLKAEDHMIITFDDVPIYLSIKNHPTMNMTIATYNLSDLEHIVGKEYVTQEKARMKPPLEYSLRDPLPKRTSEARR